MPFTLTNGINIPAGFETYVRINRVLTNKLPKPYSNCINSLSTTSPYLEKLFGYFKKLNISYYDQNFCFTLCFQDKLLSDCGCLDITTPPINGVSYCANDLEIACLNRFDINFTTTDINSLCGCPQQCNLIEYDLTISSATFPTFNYLQNLATDRLTANFFPSNASKEDLIVFANIGFLKLIVNYDNLFYTSYTDNPSITSDAVWGTIGGQLGLCAGIGLLNMCEFIAIFVTFVYSYIENKNKLKEETEMIKSTGSSIHNVSFIVSEPL